LIFIASAYIAIYLKSTSAGPDQSSLSQTAKARKIQRKITILILTDMCCWLPICVMSFLSIAGTALPPVLYAVSAITLLPVNSSLNPIIYTDVVPKCFEVFHHFFGRLRDYFQQCRNLISIRHFSESSDELPEAQHETPEI